MSLLTRRRKVEHLAAAGDVTGLREALVHAVRDREADDVADEVVPFTASALVHLGDQGVSALVDVVLSHPGRPALGRIEADTFHHAAGPHAVALLSRALLHDPDREVRLTASGMLRRLGTALADQAFAAAVHDPDARVRLSAARGLADLGDPRGVPALLEWVAHADDPVPALAGLVRLGDPDVVPVLEQLRGTSRTSYAATATSRAIDELRSHPALGRGPVERLVRVRDHLRSIELVDRRPQPGDGALAQRARRQVPALCAQIDRVVAALRAGTTPDGRPVNRTQLGVVLAGLVVEYSGDEFDRLMGSLLEPRGIRALRQQVVALDLVATELQERQPTARPPVDREPLGSELERDDPTIGV